MKRLLFYTALLTLPTLYSSDAQAQYNHDIGIRVGAANYLGEIGGKEQTRRDFIYDMQLNQTSFSVGGFYRFRFNRTLSLNSSLQFGRIRGSDNASENRGRTGRNLSFRNDLWEVSSRLEWTFFDEYDVGGHHRNIMSFQSYLFGGLGLTYHNPKALYQGQWLALRPLRTEGQQSQYSLVTPVVPLGAGFHFTYDKRYRFGFELGWRTTFTDYLDDASTSYASPEELGYDPLRIALANRNPELENGEDIYAYPDPAHYTPGNKRGDASHNDSYLFTTFSFSYTLRGKCFSCPKRNYRPRSKWRRYTRPKFVG